LKIATYKDFERIKKLEKTIKKLENSDFSQVKKLSNLPYYRIKVNDADRIIFTFFKFEDEKYIFHNESINNMLAIDFKTYMTDDILTKVDRATMSVGLEGREPLLDHRIIEFAAQLPSSFKYNNGEKKWILKQITHKYLPKKMMDRPKMGFAVPIAEWFKDELKQYFLIYLNKERLDKESIFKSCEIIKLRDKYLGGDKENVQRLWFILMFQMWYERWM